MNAMRSYLHQPLEQPLSETTIGKFFAEQARLHAGRLAVVDDRMGCRWSYLDLADKVSEWRKRLADLNVVNGDRIALLCENSGEWVAVWLACASVGVVVASLNLTLDAAELKARMHRLGISHVFASEYALTSTGLKSGPTCKTPSATTDIHVLPAADICGSTSLDVPRPALPASEPQSPCLICFSSGTTGHAKAIMLTHRNLLNNALLVGKTLGYGADDSVFCLFPYLVAGGAVIGVLSVLARGATIVCPPPERRRSVIVESLNRHRPRYLMASPRLAEIIFSEASATDPFVANLKHVGMGSTTCLPKFVNKLLTGFSVPEVSLIYGMSETSPVTFLHTIDEPVHGETVSVGKLLPGLEAKIVDASGRIMTHGVDGELCVRGHAVMAGYCDDIDATKRIVDADGWLHTGDIARFDENDQCFVFGRQSECIRFATGTLHPHVLERVLLRHPSVENAQVAVLPNGECFAWVKTADETSITQQTLSDYYDVNRDELPPIMHLSLVSSFPLNETGKIQRSTIIEQMLLRIEGKQGTDQQLHALSLSAHKHRLH